MTDDVEGAVEVDVAHLGGFVPPVFGAVLEDACVSCQFRYCPLEPRRLIPLHMLKIGAMLRDVHCSVSQHGKMTGAFTRQSIDRR